jgi:hypothetical protein
VKVRIVSTLVSELTEQPIFSIRTSSKMYNFQTMH